MVRIVSFGPEHACGVADVASRQGYPTYAEPRQATRVITAPGCSGQVAVENDVVVGFAHVSSNGMQAYLWTIVVVEDYRRKGIGQQLIAAAFASTGAARMDLLAVPESREFYASFPHHEFEGFRLYPSTP